MLLLDLSLPTAAENLALDEALLDSVDDDPEAPELLRLWECPQHAVVLGRSCKVDEEVHRQQCERDSVPILRRVSGGGTVVLGPGCLVYSLRLSYQQRPEMRMLDEVHRQVLETNSEALNELLENWNIGPQGTSDLVVADHKFSGNSVRCKRHHLLYHGTILYNFDLAQVGRWLKPPPRQPDYRRSRSHQTFIRNIKTDPRNLREALVGAWQADQLLHDWPRELTAKLLQDRYSRPEWNFER